MSRGSFLGMLIFVLLAPHSSNADGPPKPTRMPLLRAVDLDVGESATLRLSNDAKATVRLDKLDIIKDPIRNDVRKAIVSVTIDGQAATISSGNYELPRTVGLVQVDCPIVKAYLENSTEDSWGIEKAARLRLWPANSPWIEPETFVYPAKQAWFASSTQMANEPSYVDAGEVIAKRKTYYHSGLDLGGTEGLVTVVAATDGLVVSSKSKRLPGYDDSPIAPRYDVVYLLDDRGWYYRYSHFESIDSAIVPGALVKKGQKLGILGKEGGSGGWTHLHFEAKSRQPSGKWGTQEGYAFLWQAAVAEQKPSVIAVARPHHFARVGDKVLLDGSKSWSHSGEPLRFEWILANGKTSEGERISTAYTTPGAYSEILKVTDSHGHIAYDFAVVQIIDTARPEALPPTIHAARYPTGRVKAGEMVTFKVRTFRVGRDGGQEIWDFGDGITHITTQSDGNAEQHAPDGYGVTTHRFAQPGDYLVKVERVDRRGLKATARLHVRVE